MDKLIQQVNFYKQSFRREKKRFSAVTMLLLVVLVGAGLLLTTLVAMKQTADLEQVVQQKTQQKNLLKQQLETLQDKLKPRAKSEHLENVKRAKLAALKDIKKVKRLLDDVLSVSNITYSGYFQGLAETRVSGLWLDHLLMAHSGRTFQLSGQALSPELVPRLLLELQKQDSFKGSAFQTANIEENKDTGLLKFSLETVAKEGQGQ